MTDLREVIARAVGCIPVVDDMPLGPVACNELADAALAAIQSAGYVVVPVEPSEAMVRAGIQQAAICTDDWNASSACIGEHVYRAMIEAAK